MSEKNTYESAFEAGAASAHPHDIGDDVRGLVVPQGYVLQSLERFEANPSSKRGTVTFIDVDSFARYVNVHKSDQTAMFALSDNTAIWAALDHHSAAAPGWARHVAVLTHQPTTSWKAWAKLNGSSVTQVQLAEFLEDRIIDVAVPAGADLLELITKFELKRDVAFASAVNLQNGLVQLGYTEADSSKGTIDVPKALTLGITPFFGDPLYKVTARLRYRLAEGKVAFTVKLAEPELVIEQAVTDRVKAIASATGITPYRGIYTAPAAL